MYTSSMCEEDQYNQRLRHKALSTNEIKIQPVLYQEDIHSKVVAAYISLGSPSWQHLYCKKVKLSASDPVTQLKLPCVIGRCKLSISLKLISLRDLPKK